MGGTRSHKGHSMLHALSAPISPQTSADIDENNYEFDFIEAANQAALERENRLVHQQHLQNQLAKESKPIAPPSPLLTTVMTTMKQSENLPNNVDEDDYEFDFLEAATMAAVEREQREALEAAASSFDVNVVYNTPSVAIEPLLNARSQNA